MSTTHLPTALKPVTQYQESNKYVRGIHMGNETAQGLSSGDFEQKRQRKL